MEPRWPQSDYSSSPVTEGVVADASSDPIQTLADRLAAELADHWRHGRQIPVEELFQRHPELTQHREPAFRLICEEICLREEAGLEIAPDQFVARFPQWQAEIQVLLDCRLLLQPETGIPPVSPHGPILDDFHSLKELGRGSQGNVYLARQLSLGDRPVVLKISPRHGQEHLSLARLQHTHIAPLYWVHDNPEQDERILCMPFFGTVTLADLLQALKDKPPQDRRGQDILDVLDRSQETIGIDQPGPSPARNPLIRLSYVQAVCWVGGCLADALQYAHDRGLVHLDLKPSNVLLTGDGQPMLLDFHLAREPIRPDGPRPRGIGGTPMYMSPEQHLLVDAVRTGGPIPAAVDGGSDIYSLGLVLYQLLGGPVPLPASVPRLEKCNPAVPLSVADIIHKCLEVKADQRYADAGTLAADFRLHLAFLPLRGVPNRSWKESWEKWRQRSPSGLKVWILGALVSALILGMTTMFFLNLHSENQDRLTRMQQTLMDGNQFYQEKNYSRAMETYSAGLDLAGQTWGAEDLAGLLTEKLNRAKSRKRIVELHQLTDQIRFAAAALEAFPTRLASLEKNCRLLWKNRTRIMEALTQETETALQNQVRLDMIDLTLIATDLRIRLAPGPAAQSVRQEGLETLDEAEKLFGVNPVLYREKGLLAEKLGKIQEAQEASQKFRDHPPKTAWENYALGLSFYRQTDYPQAIRYFNQAVTLDPGGFWPNFYQGVCLFRMERYLEAVSAFRVCVALEPDSAPPYFNRGLALSRVPDIPGALADYSRAQEIDPTLAEAVFSRGLLYLQKEHFARAIQDLKTALTKGSDPALTHYHLARAYLGQKQPAAAAASLRDALRFRPNFPEARKLAQKLKIRGEGRK